MPPPPAPHPTGPVMLSATSSVRIGSASGSASQPGAPRSAAAGTHQPGKRSLAWPEVLLMQPYDVANKAIGMMQRTAKNLMRVCKEQLDSGKPLDVYELKELKVMLERIADGLEQDSLYCQEALDAPKYEYDLDDGLDEELLAMWPESPPVLRLEEVMSREEHIETYWGVEYDSDNMPSFSD